MNLTKVYKDSEGFEVNILQLVKQEPEWAANIIQHYETENAALKAKVEELKVRVEATEPEPDNYWEKQKAIAEEYRREQQEADK
jgi:regulator of replication initiation timing